jgi:hypothetical protein
MANFLINNNFYIPTANPGTPIIADPIYESRAVFSINASNQLQGTFWVVKNGVHLAQNLGTASFTVRDQDGAAIGITESNIVADSNGFYHITPVLANVIQDLTHYVVELSISAESQIRKGAVGITLGE